MKLKKLFCGCLVAALAVTGGATGFAPAAVHATSDKAKQQVVKKQQITKEKLAKYREGEAIVLMKNAAGPAKTKSAVASQLKGDFTVAESWSFKKAEKPMGKRTATTKGNQKIFTFAKISSKDMTTKQLLSALKKNKSVKKAEPNYIYRATAAGLTDDQYINQQWALENHGQNGGKSGSGLNVNSVWSKGTKGTDKVVAIVDTGVDYNHEDIKANMWNNPFQSKLHGQHGFDFANGDDDPLDDNGHGTHCAGIIGAQGNNKTGISGVNQSAKIMALKFLNADGEGDASNAIAAYDYISEALDLGVNVVAINNSYGGGGESEFTGMLMDLVGEKGAISVCAAGNESADNDKIAVDPANADSPYNVSVAASNEANELADFSNYGKKEVELAAPGADILSSVSYNCFNPGLYKGKTDALCSYFANYDNDKSADVKWGMPDAASASKYTATLDSDTYFGENGKSLKASVKDAKAGDMITVRIPYTIGASKTKTQVSAMVKTAGPKATDKITIFNTDIIIPSYSFLIEVPQGEEIKSETILDSLEDDQYVEVSEKANYWSHLACKSGAETSDREQKRDIIFGILCNYDGEYAINIDDLGVTKENVSEDQYGKYDYYNGTSMATPYVTGAAALLNKTEKGMTADELIGKLTAFIKKEPAMQDKVQTGGVLDLSQTAVLAPRISDVTVDTKKGEIQIKGSGFNAGSTVTVNGKAAAIVAATDKMIRIKNDHWINKIVNLSVAGANGKTTKENVYLVKGKTAYQTVAAADRDYESTVDTISTDGTYLYTGSGYGISKFNPAGKNKELEEIIYLDASKFFKKETNSWTQTQLYLGADMPYLDGKLYNLAALSKIIYSEIEEDDWNFTEVTAPYSSRYCLISMDPKKEKSQSLGQLPKDVQNIGRQTVTAYNGKLYVIGGYDYTKRALSKVVKIYDPKTKKWSNGPALPEGRGAGKAIQVGNSLIYTLGYTDKKTCPKNLILTGNKWKSTATQIKPYNGKTEKISGKEYTLYGGSIGLCSGGILYSGIPTEGLGDTFSYNISKDRYTAATYHCIKKIDKNSFAGTVVGSTLYGFDENDQLLKANATSGLVKVTAGKRSGGTISGANKGYLPGMNVTLTPSPKKGYYVKSFTVNGKKVKGKSKTIRITQNMKASATFAKYVTSVKLNKKSAYLKAGKTLKLKVSVAPKNAGNKSVSYKSGNKKYAAVSKHGVVEAKRAGIGKTVTIKATAKDGSKKSASCKIKITY